MAFQSSALPVLRSSSSCTTLVKSFISFQHSFSRFLSSSFSSLDWNASFHRPSNVVVPLKSPLLVQGWHRNYTSSASSSTHSLSSSFSSSSSYLQEPSSTLKSKSKVSSIQSGFVGMLVGILIAGGLSYSQLLKDYDMYSSTFMNHLNSLTQHVAKIREWLSQTEQFALELKAMQKEMLKPQEFEQFRNQVHQLLDRLETDQIALKARIYALEQESIRSNITA